MILSPWRRRFQA